MWIELQIIKLDREPRRLRDQPRETDAWVEVTYRHRSRLIAKRKKTSSSCLHSGIHALLGKRLRSNAKCTRRPNEWKLAGEQWNVVASFGKWISSRQCAVSWSSPINFIANYWAQKANFIISGSVTTRSPALFCFWLLTCSGRPACDLGRLNGIRNSSLCKRFLVC